MIDTIKISVYKEFNESIYNTCLYNSENYKSGFRLNSVSGQYEKIEMFSGLYHQYDNHMMMLIKGTMKQPSWDYNINYRMFDDRIDIEFSLPKFIYGTNAIELRSHYFKFKTSPYEMLVKGIKKYFEYFFSGHKVNYGGVSIQRWDFCYNQLFESKDESLKALEYIKKKYNKKHDTLNYETSFIALTKSQYFKIYHKGTEFIKHDLDKLPVYQKNILALADLTLRYEKKVTIKNLAYWYNVNIKYGKQNPIVKQYLKCKKLGTITKQMRSDFENVQKFTLGNSLLEYHTKLDSFMFDHLYTIFRDEIKKKYNIGNSSIDRLHHEVINTYDKKNRTKKIKILSFIKTFGSIRRAYEKKAISKSTFYEYEKFMLQKNLSSTNVKSNIKQDWISENYFNNIIRQGINVNHLSNDMNF